MVSFHGTPSHIVALGEETLGTYDATRGTSEPGGGAPPHVHPCDEGFYIVSGEMTFHAGNAVVQLAQGDFINIRGGTAHFPKNDSKAPADLLVICAPAGFANSSSRWVSARRGWTGYSQRLLLTFSIG